MSKKELFPAQAGVIPALRQCQHNDDAVPRASGGDPPIDVTGSESGNCSPRKRG